MAKVDEQSFREKVVKLRKEMKEHYSNMTPERRNQINMLRAKMEEEGAFYYCGCSMGEQAGELQVRMSQTVNSERKNSYTE